MRDAPLPQDVPGYEGARREGLLPEVPAAPPALIAGPTADQASSRVFLWLGGAVVGFFLLVKFGPGVLALVGLPRSAAMPPIGLIGLAMLVGLYRAWASVGERNLEELRRGYTTLTLIAGSFWRGDLRRWPTSGHRVPWDYSGAWLLSNDGDVSREPDRGVLPPGLYPSPNREGRWELWSGCVWTGDFRPPSGTTRQRSP